MQYYTYGEFIDKVWLGSAFNCFYLTVSTVNILPHTPLLAGGGEAQGLSATR